VAAPKLTGTELTITGVNLHIVSGSGRTDDNVGSGGTLTLPAWETLSSAIPVKTVSTRAPAVITSCWEITTATRAMEDWL
jgi:hypothetical protein